jgi:hypothetical protein
MLALRLPKETTERLDSWCVGTGMSRSEAIRLMIQFGLTANPAVLREAIGPTGVKCCPWRCPEPDFVLSPRSL